MTRLMGTKRAISKPVVVGKPGSMSFNGTTSSFASAGSLTVALDAFSCEAWIYLTSISASHQLIFGVSGANGLTCSVTNTGFHIGRFNASAITIDASFNFTFNLNTWYHVVWTRTSTAAGGCYGMVNGTLVSTGTSSVSYGGGGLRLGGTSVALSQSGNSTNIRFILANFAYSSTGYTVPTTSLSTFSGCLLLMNVRSSAGLLVDDTGIFTAGFTNTGVTFSSLTPYTF